MRILILSVLMILTAQISKAQYYDSSPSLVFSAEVAIPMSDYADRQSFGAGASAKLRFPAGETSDVFVTGSAIMFKGGKTLVNNKGGKYKSQGGKAVSALVGYRLYLNPLSDPNSFYIQADAGLTAATSKLIGPTLAPSLGYLINDKLDLFLKYHSTFSNNPALKVNYISFGIGYGLSFQ